MSQYERNMEYLINHKVIYRQDPVDDKPTEVYEWGYFYEEGTRQCYTLFNSRAKINTYKSLKWHLYVLWYLNPKMDQEGFAGVVKYICNKKAGFITFEVSDQLAEKMIYDVSLMDLERPPPNKLRKIIFKDFTGLDMRQKLSIGAHRMVAAVRAGVVHVNTFGGADNTVPLGGYKQSGNGQDKSLLAIDKFTNRKTVWIKL